MERGIDQMPRIQMHLSTALVLMFSAGGFILINLNEYPAYIDDMSQGFLQVIKDPIGDCRGSGWPWGFHATGGRFGEVWNYGALMWDVVVAFAALVLIGVGVEWVVNQYYHKRRLSL